MNKKFHLVCYDCGHIIQDFTEWFEHSQKCSKCGSKRAEVNYSKDISGLKDLLTEKNSKAENVWHYFDYLPLNNKENIITQNEGVIPVDNWTFLEKFAKDNVGITCEVHAYRNDLNGGTGTFKDVAAAVAASVLKENNVKEYCVASTGNIATAYSRYLAIANITNSVFMPSDALKASEAEINSYGQKVFRLDGDYAKAKHVAAAYSEKYGVLLSGGNVDPMRVEAKKTMVFEWLRLMKNYPTVYIQALSGGTGPIAIEKAHKDIKDLNLVSKLPRFIMVQPDKCDPMTQGWNAAKENGFPEGWEKQYPIIDNPVTEVPTLATGNPATFPIIASLVKKSGGEIITFAEDEIVDVAKLIAHETCVRIGPAATIAVGGFFESLKQGLIKNGDVVLINVGEGVKRAPEFAEKLIYTTQIVDSINDCKPTDRNSYLEELYKPFDKYRK